MEDLHAAMTGVSDNVAAARGVGPFISIWFQPRATIRQIVADDPSRHVALLAALSGIEQTFDRAMGRSTGDHMSLALILALALLVGPVAGLLTLAVSTFLVRVAGEWLGGAGDSDHVKAALAWASMPQVAGLLLWIPMIVVFGHGLFSSAEQDYSVYHGLLLVAGWLTLVVLGGWSGVLACHTVAEVHGFASAWRGLACLVLAGAIVIVPVVVIGVGLLLFARAL